MFEPFELVLLFKKQIKTAKGIHGSQKKFWTENYRENNV